MKKILITGKGSFIGINVENWLKAKRYDEQYEVDVLDMLDKNWKEFDFSKYDSIFHVAGIAHADISNVSEETKMLYYNVNCNLAVETAMKAKAEGVKQFIYMSSLLVYGDSGNNSYKDKNKINSETKPNPSNFYGDSKWQAEIKLRKLDSTDFHIAILRPPMIYGSGCKGNYNALAKIALKSPIFPDFDNKRSVLYVGNLCEFVRLLIDSGESGTFIPQNKEYVKTSDFIRYIAEAHHKKVKITPVLNWAVKLAACIPGKAGALANKAFGTEYVDSNTLTAFDGKYQIFNFKKSVIETEKLK